MDTLEPETHLSNNKEDGVVRKPPPSRDTRRTEKDTGDPGTCKINNNLHSMFVDHAMVRMYVMLK